MAWPFGKPSSIIGSSEPGSIYLGRYWNAETKQVEGKLQYGGPRHVVVLAPTGAGKGTRILVPNQLQIKEKSLVVIDPKGQNAAIGAPWRRKVGKVRILNPFGHLTSTYPDLKSAGFNPLASLDPASPTFYEDAAGIGEALIRIEGKEKHWSESAQGLLVGLIMWEVIEARRQRRAPSLERIRYLLTEPDGYAMGHNGKQVLVKGLRITARKMCDGGNDVISSLAGRFLRGNDEMASIQSTADTQTRWLLSAQMRADLKKNGIDFASLKSEPTTVYVVLPAEYMETHSTWLRLVVTVALRALYKPGGVPVLFMLDEFAHLGRLKAIELALGIVRNYNVQVMPVLQSLIQLKHLYEDAYENFLGQSGAIVGLTPNDWTTADWMSRRSGENTIRQPTVNTNQNPGGIGTSMGEGYGRRAYLMPQNLFGVREGFGFIWCAGLARPIPSYMPPYWDVDTWARRARRDPYHFGKTA